MFKIPRILTFDLTDDKGDVTKKIEIDVQLILLGVIVVLCMAITNVAGYDKGYREGAYWGYNNCTVEFGHYNKYVPNNDVVNLKYWIDLNDTTVSNARNKCWYNCIQECCPGCTTDLELNVKCPQCIINCDSSYLIMNQSQ